MRGNWFIDVSGAVESVQIASTMPERLRGMLFRDPDEVTRILVPCSDVHTFGMHHPLDIAFISRDGGVLEVHRGVGARKRLYNREAAMVFERFARAGDWLAVGDMVRIGAPSPSQRSSLACKGTPVAGKVTQVLSGEGVAS